MDGSLILIAGYVAALFVMLLPGISSQSSEREPPVLSWRAAAEELGFERKGERFVRRLGKRITLELSGRSEGRQAGERVQVRARIVPEVSVPIGIGGYDGRRSDVSGGHDFDQRYTVKSSAPASAAKLLTSELARALVRAHIAGYSAKLDSRDVRVEGRWLTQLGEMQRLCDAAEEIARALVAAEKQVPRLVPLAVVARVWTVAAQALGGSFDRETRVLGASAQGGALLAQAETEREEQWYGSARFDFGKPLSPELAIVDEGVLSPEDKARDLELGDPQFDDLFFVTTPDQDAARRVLDAEVRARLLAARRLALSLRVDAQRIEARYDAETATDDDRLEAALRALVDAGEALSMAATTGRGTYR